MDNTFYRCKKDVIFMIKKIITRFNSGPRIGEDYIDYYYNVTHKARNIFGDIVKEAWQHIGISFEEDTAYYINHMLDWNIKKIDIRKDGFDADDGHLIIIFKNNKVIYINGSGLIHDYVKEFNKEFKLENYK